MISLSKLKITLWTVALFLAYKIGDYLIARYFPSLVGLVWMLVVIVLIILVTK